MALAANKELSTHESSQSPSSPSQPVPWHTLSPDEAVAACGSSRDGLSPEEVASRQEQNGKNETPRPKTDSVFVLLWRQINSPLIWVLIASAFVAIVADPSDGLKNGLVILAVVILNTLIGFIQEFKASKAIQSLSSMVPEQCTVLRKGQRIQISATELVAGDIVFLASGDKVPADMRLLEIKSLQIEEAALTGESVPTEKSLTAVSEDAAVGDRRCMAYAGTLVTYGTGTGLVTEIGTRTELGKISEMLRETTDFETPFTKALRQIGFYITVAIAGIANLMLAIGTFRAVSATGVTILEGFRETLIFAIALAVGAIPEGLPAVVTIALAIGVQRMAARKAIVRKLPAVETLGSTTVICSDKTGTLTKNEMTVQALWTPRGSYDVSGVGYAPHGGLSRDGSNLEEIPDDVENLLRAGALCNDASLAQEQERWEMSGDPTEGALIVSAQKLGLDPSRMREELPRVDAIPFESENQFMVTLHRGSSASDGELILKGAPEAVLARCVGLAGGGPLEPSVITDQVNEFASHGMRILGFARKSFGGQEVHPEDVAEGFEFLGLQGMIDPPRQEAKDAIGLCHKAGIVVKMITGDHRATAQAIGEELGLGDRAINGAELEKTSPQELERLAHEYNVFARVSPEHKMKLVQALQRSGHVVAMTGDGVNDAPALKQANIGVAMGITGTSVSKESAAIVLTDDNFASIAAAVEEGRRVYDNLIKSLAFILPTNLGLAMILMVAVGFFPFIPTEQMVDGVMKSVQELLLPLSPAQILWINLVATVALALPLAFEAKEPNLMDRPPRAEDSPILSAFVITRTVVVAVLMTVGCIGLFLYELNAAQAAGAPSEDTLAKAQTVAVTTVIMFQIFYLLNCRSLKDPLRRIGIFSNPTIFLGIFALITLQLCFIYTPILQRIFVTAPLTLSDLVGATIVGALVLPVVSVEKWWRSRDSAVKEE